MLNSIYQIILPQDLSWYIVFAPLIGAFINGFYSLLAARFGFSTSKLFSAVIGCLAPFFSFFITILIFITLTGFESPQMITGPLFNWVVTGNLTVSIGLKFDQLSLVMAFIVTGVGSLIHLYSIGYMAHDKGFSRYFAYINLFLFFMLLLILGDSLVLLFVGWEGVGLCSYLLIGFWFEDAEKAYAGKKAFIVNRIGDAAFLIGMFLIYVTLAGQNLPVAEHGNQFFSK